MTTPHATTEHTSDAVDPGPAGSLLAGRVVLISGVGPGLGTTLATRCARQGADVVLAARTAERLDAVAEQVRALGARALPVPTDLTDEDSVAALVERARTEFGHVDVLVHNAFTVPSRTPLADTALDHIRDSIELTVLAALRLTRLLTPALAEREGSVVTVNSMVLRHSQLRYGSYKLAKSALLSLSQSLATELGPQGIRVNSVAPGYIWGDTLKSYFAHQAAKYGTTSEEIYRHTASGTDLGRLPEESDVADAVIFLASTMARGITGQCLDVNCGEYHH